MSQELQIYGLWAGKQTAKGTPLATPAHRFKQVGGGFTTNIDDGSENYSDATQFTDTLDWRNTIAGNGNPVIHATPQELAFLLWMLHGGETTRAVTGPPAKTQHTTVPLPGLGHWGTWVQRVGSSILRRESFNDCQVGQLVIEGSTAAKAVRITPTVLSLDPGALLAADPSAVLPTERDFLFTDGTAAFRIDGSVFRGFSQFALTINKDLQPQYSDDVTIYDLAIGTPTVTLGVTCYFDADGLAQYNKLVYGDPAPVAGTKPLHNIPALGSYAFTLSAKDARGVANGDTFTLTVNGVKWSPPPAPQPNPDGGSAEIALTGAMRKVSGRPDFQIDVNCDAAAFTA